MLNESMELNSRRSYPLDALGRFTCEFSAQPLVSAAVAHFNHSPTMRAERAKLKSWREDMKVAQGKRGTSAALG